MEQKTANTVEQGMDHELMNVILEAKKQIVAETTIPAQAVDNIFKKILFNFIKL